MNAKTWWEFVNAHWTFDERTELRSIERVYTDGKEIW